MKSGEIGPINLGSDLDYKIIDVARKVIELTGSKAKIVFEISDKIRGKVYCAKELMNLLEGKK